VIDEKEQPVFEIPKDQWCDSDGGESRLHTSIEIGGLGAFYLTAFRVGRLCGCGGEHGVMPPSHPPCWHSSPETLMGFST
jgi:hypothetical protein